MGSTTSVGGLHIVLALTHSLNCDLFPDTAQAYRNENEVGKAIADSGLGREDLWVTSKVSMFGLDELPMRDLAPHSSLDATTCRSQTACTSH